MTETEPTTPSRQSDVLRALLTYALDAIVVVDRDGRVFHDSAAMEAMTGARPGQRLGQLLFDNVHAHDLPRLLATIARAVAATEPVGPFQFRYQHANGTWRTFEAVARGFALDASHPVCLMSARDVTGRLVFDEEVRRTQRMEALERLAGSIAHDFNNVLTTILGNAELLLTGAHANVLRPQVAEIRAAAEVAASLVRQLQLFSEKRLTRSDVVDAYDTVERMEAVLRRMVGSDVRLAIGSTVAGPAHVQLPHGNLEQVVMNLVVNARDAMPKGGRIDITIARSPVYAGENGPRDFVTVRVADTGIGMPPHVRARIFEPYFTTKAVGQGTGLGLATVYGIVADAGGTIDVSTAVGQGTTFDVHLPRALPQTN